MGGCATKPSVLKDEANAPQTTEEPITAAHPADPAMKEHKDENPEEAADGQKSLGNLFKEKEVEEIVATVNEEKPEEIHNAAVEEKVQLEPTAEEKTPAVDA